MQIFYSTHISENQVDLLGDEFNHCKNVLRLKVGDLINITDGKGSFLEAKIDSYTKEKAQLSITKTISLEQKKRNYSLEIVIAPTKNIDRIEWFVEKVVEIGVDQISFITSRRSERKVINLERIEKIAVSAMKQSGKCWLPILKEIQPFEKMINQETDNSHKFIAHLIEGEERRELKNAIADSLKKQEFGTKHNYQILIGPEGDFTDDEVKLALNNNYLPVSLGEFRLRTETAGLMACSTFAIVLN